LCSNLLHARHGIIAVFGLAVAAFGCALIFFTPSVVSLRHSASLWWYFYFALISSCPAWYRCGIRLCCGSIRLCPNLLHARCGIIAVFGFTVAVFSFALISSRLAWYRCGIRLRCGSIRLLCGGIRLRPNFFTSGVVLLRYSASLWQYSASP